MKRFNEDAPVVTTTANPTTQEPVVAVDKQKKYRKRNKKAKKIYEEADSFAGNVAFEVDSDTFSNLTQCKAPWDRYNKIIQDEELCDSIRDYSHKNPGKNILIKDQSTGSYRMLKKGKNSNI